MRRGRLDRVVEFDVGELGAADDALLRLRGQRVPAVQVVQIFLHDHVAAARERGILVADERSFDHRLPTRILRAVDEPQEVAVIEVAKAMHLVDRRDRVAERRHDLRRHLEAEVHPLGADMEQQVPWGRNRMARSGADLAERMKFGRARIPEQPVPRLGPDSHHAGEPGFEVAKLNRANQARKVRAERPHGRADCRRPGLSSRPGRSRRA